MKCELQPSLLPVRVVVAARAGADASASVGVGVKAVVGSRAGATGSAAAAAGDGVPCRAGAGVGVGASVDAHPPVDQPDPLTWSVPNLQLDQTELLPLSVLEQLPVLDPLLKVVPMCEAATIVSGLL